MKDALASAMPQSRACEIWASSFADRSSALLGTHPVLRQSPPRRCFSTSATLALVTAAMYDATSPAEPAPTTTTL